MIGQIGFEIEIRGRLDEWSARSKELTSFTD